MKIKPALSNNKSLQIDKAQSTMLAVVVGATIITVFCLVSAKVLLGQALYQRRVINARDVSAKQLETNIKNANTLSSQYNSVLIGSDSNNVIGGSNSGGDSAVPPDGDNGKIVLDALPTSYDFPALLTSLSKLLGTDGVGAQSIGGADQSISVDSSPTYNPAPSNIDVTISGASTYADSKKLLTDLERSIRPFDVTHLTLSGNESSLSMSLNVTTYYQPAKTLTIPSKEIK